MVGAPGAAVPAVRGVSFRVEPGKAVGIAGASASGKSTLARALAGVWPARAGRVTLGGAALEQYGEEVLARHIGWLPQEVVAVRRQRGRDIARLDPDPDGKWMALLDYPLPDRTGPGAAPAAVPARRHPHRARRPPRVGSGPHLRPAGRPRVRRRGLVMARRRHAAGHRGQCAPAARARGSAPVRVFLALG